MTNRTTSDERLSETLHVDCLQPLLQDPKWGHGGSNAHGYDKIDDLKGDLENLNNSGRCGLEDISRTRAALVWNFL